MRKNDLRKLYKSKRSALSDETVAHYSTLITQLVVNTFVRPQMTVSLFFTIAHQKEVQTNALFYELIQKDCRVTGTVSNFDALTLEHRTVSDLDELQLNAYGIPEPQQGAVIHPHEFDIVFVPMLIADERGFRVGYGKGFYDRFLAQCSTSCQFVGLNFFDPISSIEDVNDFDLPLTHLVTPENVYAF